MIMTQILQQICENLKGWSKNAIFLPNFSIFGPKFFLGGAGGGGQG
jgi:hypothetical protein